MRRPSVSSVYVYPGLVSDIRPAGHELTACHGGKGGGGLESVDNFREVANCV